MEVSSPDVFKKTKHLSCSPPKKSAGNFFFQLNLYIWVFLLLFRTMKIPSCDSTIFTKGVCLAGQVGMFLGGASRGDDCFLFLGVTFHVSSPLDVYYTKTHVIFIYK